MNKQESVEYWRCLSEAELIIRLGLYYDRIAELETLLEQMTGFFDGAAAECKRLREQGERREDALIKQVDIVIDLQQYIAELEAKLQSIGGIFSPSKVTSEDMTPKAGLQQMEPDDYLS